MINKNFLRCYFALHGQDDKTLAAKSYLVSRSLYSALQQITFPTEETTAKSIESWINSFNLRYTRHGMQSTDENGVEAPHLLLNAKLKLKAECEAAYDVEFISHDLPLAVCLRLLDEASPVKKQGLQISRLVIPPSRLWTVRIDGETLSYEMSHEKRILIGTVNDTNLPLVSLLISKLGEHCEYTDSITKSVGVKISDSNTLMLYNIINNLYKE